MKVQCCFPQNVELSSYLTTRKNLNHQLLFSYEEFNGSIEFFLNGAELSLNSLNSEKLINHGSMNWAQFKVLVSHICLTGTVVASWYLTQEVAVWQVRVLLML